ncbi:hypothetical protein ACFO0M_00260 [Micromonospora mangrovi]|uniref:Uncharacterized protein n=2 Tax=Micromonospora TaxID=1873 RepID=A0AAU7MAI0_9ACTN
MFELVYELLLMLGGIAMIVTGLAIREQGTGSRILNAVIGLAFFCYGFYLMFLAPVGTRYRIFFYAFILPILLIVRAVKARKEAKEAREAAAVHHQVVPGQVYPAAPGQPAQGWPAPGQAAPQGHPGEAPQGQYPPQGGYGPAPQGQYGQVPQGQPGHPTA